MKLPYYPVGTQTSLAKLNDVENLRANLEAYKDYVEARFDIMEKRLSKAEDELVNLKAKKKSSSRKNKSVDVASSSLGSEKLDS